MRSAVALVLSLVFVAVACGGDDKASRVADTDSVSMQEVLTGDAVQPDAVGDGGVDAQSSSYSYLVPLAPDSPWPKFRGDAAQTGRSPVAPSTDGQELWVYKTAKGIFSTPVVGGDGTIYIGSADRTFYALNRFGAVVWQEETGEIIDSSALLDDKGRVYWGSGDGVLRARDASTGDFVWDFEADPPEENSAFINWFEGNVAMGPGGTLYVPNDNWFIYAIDRDTGEVKWRFTTPDQTWSLPAVDGATGTVYMGNNNLLPMLGDNVFAADSDGNQLWSASTVGTIAASLLLADGRLHFGGFDGFLHVLDAADGAESWSFPARDHIYASAGQLSDGTLIQPGCDGSVYAFASDGALLWAYDIKEPIRSSPAIDGNDNIYMGTGDGRLLVLNPDGTRRWSLQLIHGDRNDLNASPALGEEAIYVAGESGEIFSVPYDWCLRPDLAGAGDCSTLEAEDLPEEDVSLLWTTHHGAPVDEPPAAIDANRPMAFTLLVRDKKETLLALIDSDSLEVDVSPEVPIVVEVSADRRFLTIAPETHFAVGADSKMHMVIAFDYLTDPDREGLKMSGGTVAGVHEEVFAFEVTGSGGAVPELDFPEVAGEQGTVWEISRLAAPIPTLLPSYNQIGFDSLHFLVGLVEGPDEAGVAWMMGARLNEATGEVEPDPDTGSLFPLTVRHGDGLLTLAAKESFALEAMNAVLAFDAFHIAARLNDKLSAPGGGTFYVSALCSGIAMYGAFLRELGMCNPQTDTLVAFGTALIEPAGAAAITHPGSPGNVEFALTEGGLEATLTGAELAGDAHRYALLVIDSDTDLPVPLDYGLDTELETADGKLTRVLLKAKKSQLPANLRIHLMADTTAVATGWVSVD